LSFYLAKQTLLLLQQGFVFDVDFCKKGFGVNDAKTITSRTPSTNW
jgi:hypothetical protein